MLKKLLFLTFIFVASTANAYQFVYNSYTGKPDNIGPAAPFSSINGNVGIGSTNPGATLDVNGTLRVLEFTLSGNNAQNGYVLTATDSSGDATWKASASGSNYWQLTAAAGNVGINTTNTVGIGTTSGSGALVVMGNIGIGSINPASNLDVEGSGTIKAAGQITANNFNSSGSTAPANGFTQSAANVLTFYTATTPALTINANQNVGVNATSPGRTLDVGGTVRMTGFTLSGNLAQNGYVLTASDSSGDAQWQAASAGSQTPWAQNINGAGYQLLNAGNIGIGSSLPGQRLDVQGTVRTVYFTMSGFNPQSGYVLTATDSSGDAQWKASSGSNYWLLGQGNVGVATYNNVGIGTITTTGNYLTVASGATGGATLNAIASANGIDTNTVMAVLQNNNSIDSSSNGLTITNHNVTFSNSSPDVAGTYYGVYDGTNAYLSGSSSLVEWGTNETWDAMIYLSSNASPPYIFYENETSGSQYNTIGTGFSNSGDITFKAINGSVEVQFATNGSVITTGQWYHIAVVKSGTTWYIFVNGVSQSLNLISGAYANAITSKGSTFLIGAHLGPSLYFPGNMQNERLSSSARWTSNFTPPTSLYSGASASPCLTYQFNGTQEGQLCTNGTFSNNLEAYAGSTDVMDMISTGNVGIGTTLPGQVLDVQGSIRTDNLGQHLFGNDGSVAIGATATTAGGIAFTTNSVEQARVSSTGNIGIGTTVPNGKLVVMSGNVGVGTVNPGVMMDVQGTIRVVPLAASSGDRYLCIDTSGVVHSAAACVGT